MGNHRDNPQDNRVVNQRDNLANNQVYNQLWFLQDSLRVCRLVCHRDSLLVSLQGSLQDNQHWIQVHNQQVRLRVNLRCNLLVNLHCNRHPVLHRNLVERLRVNPVRNLVDNRH